MFRRRAYFRERDLERELRADLELEAEERRANGLSEKEALLAARRAFGNVAYTKEEVREVWRWVFWERLRQDSAYALRTMRRSPVLAAVAVLSLSLGIGANTAIFSLCDAVLLKSLPVREPERLYYMKAPAAELPYPVYARLRDRTHTLEGLVAASSGVERAEIALGGAPTEIANVQLVSGNYFPVLGVAAAAGRLLGPQDDVTPGAHPVAVISHGYWSRRLGRDPAVVGASIRINGLPFTILGITPPEFFGTTVGYSPDIWTPIMMEQAVTRGEASFDKGTVWWLNVLGRLRPAVTVEQAAAEIGVLYRQIDREVHPGATRKAERLEPAQLLPASKGLDELRDKFSKPLQVLMVVVALVLLIACANMANLLLSRAEARGPELAVRLAIGAGRGRLVRQLLTESLLLSCAGGLGGLIFAQWGNGMLLRMASGGPAPIPLHMGPNLRTLAFTAAASLATGLLFGAAPAWRASRLDPAPNLKAHGPGHTAQSGIGPVLVSTQIAISLLLLMGAGLFVRSLTELRAVDTGFQREHLLLMGIDTRGTSYEGPSKQGLARQLFGAMNATPGVRAASFADCSAFMGCGSDGGITIPGLPQDPGKRLNFRRDAVGPRHFEAMGIPVVRGREFTEGDDPTAPKVAVVSESFARRFFPDQNPLGRRFGIGRSAAADTEIVGVVKDVKLDSVRKPTPVTFFTPLLQRNGGGLGVLEIRTEGNPLAAADLIRGKLKSIAPAVRINLVTTMEQRVDASIARERLLATLAGFFGVLALVLVSIGLYGVISYNVTRRAQEIGIRVSLGARQAGIVWMVLRRCLAMASAGIAVGLPLGWWLSRLVSTLLFGVEPHDPVIMGVAAAMLAFVAAAAGFWPAQRAARGDPLMALRYE